MVSKSDRIVCALSLILFVSAFLSCNFQPALAVDNVAVQANPINESTNPALYKVEIQRGSRRTITGTKRSYTLYLPQSVSGLPGPPYPLLVMAHGFLMSGTQQSSNAQYFAERGFAVLLPNLTRVLWGDKNRIHNIKDVIDQLSWITKQSNSKKSPFYGLIDNNRVGVAGNSSGGAVSLELVVQCQKANVPVHAMCSMDGAPWDRSWDSMAKLKPLKIISLRAEPSVCNEHARMLNFLRQLDFPFDDIKIIGAHHCDAENPTTLRCMCICGKSRSQYRDLFQQFTYLFFRDTFGAPRDFEPKKSLVELAEELQSAGRVTVRLNQQGSEKTVSIHGIPDDG